MLHADRGRKLKEGQNFRLMVDLYGNEATAVACPLCSNWQKYIAKMYSILYCYKTKCSVG